MVGTNAIRAASSRARRTALRRRLTTYRGLATGEFPAEDGALGRLDRAAQDAVYGPWFDPEPAEAAVARYAEAVRTRLRARGETAGRRTGDP
jgi:hypothetical protein